MEKRNGDQVHSQQKPKHLLILDVELSGTAATFAWLLVFVRGCINSKRQSRLPVV